MNGPNTRECIWHATEYLVAGLGVDEFGERLGRADLLQAFPDGGWQLGQPGVEVAHPGGDGAARVVAGRGHHPATPPPPLNPGPTPRALAGQAPRGAEGGPGGAA